MNSLDITPIIEILSSTKKIVVASHEHPDGDALGSALGLALALQNAGHSVDVILPDNVPDFLKWLPGFSLTTIYDQKPKQVELLLASADLVFVVDLSHPDRMGQMNDAMQNVQGMSIQIDHHPGSGGFTDYAILEPSCGSTAEIIYHFLRASSLSDYLDQQAAPCLLTGIITDTLGFRVASSYPEVFEVVMELMRVGADKDLVFENVYNHSHEGRLRLLGFILSSRMNIYPEHQAACIYLTRKDLSQFPNLKGDTEGFVNYPLTIKGIIVSAFFTEQADHVKLSLRSKGAFDVNQFASTYFNGGGHTNAAGGKYYGSMEEALSYFEKVVREVQEK